MGIAFSEWGFVIIGAAGVLGLALALAWIEATPRRRSAPNPAAGNPVD